jgi:transposase
MRPLTDEATEKVLIGEKTTWLQKIVAMSFFYGKISQPLFWRSLMIHKQKEMILSPYSALYDMVIPKDHIFRKINDLIDFSFVYDELLKNYCPNNGRYAIDPVVLFKYLLLKVIDNLSDVDVVERSRYDLSYKYFLGMVPEDPVINPSSLTKFRKLRLKDANLLDLLISKTVQIALDKGIIKSRSIIVDATHTRSRFNRKSAVDILREVSKRLRKAVYSLDESIKESLPAKSITGELEDEIEYCQKLIEVVTGNPVISEYPKVKEKLNLLQEKITDDLERMGQGSDEDARIGHKSADTSFFGYKTHIAMTEERIITAAVVTSGEKTDGKQLPDLVEKSKATGMEIETIIGDAAYSGKDNINMAKSQNIHLVSKLNPSVMDGFRKPEDVLEFNKDAGMYVCKAGHLAFRKAVQGKKGTGSNQVITYYFDVEKCKLCPLKEGCYKDGAKSKSYSVSIKSDLHEEQAAFQESKYFKKKAKERYKIEAKNSELKNRHSYHVAVSKGLENMQLQGAVSMFVVNLKRILKLV